MEVVEWWLGGVGVKLFLYQSLLVLKKVKVHVEVKLWFSHYMLDFVTVFITVKEVILLEHLHIHWPVVSHLPTIKVYVLVY